MKLIDKFFSWVFDKTWTKTVLQKSVVDDIINFAKSNHPRECSAFLAGKIKKNTLFITHLLYQNFNSDNKSTSIEQKLPLLSGSAGSVHSHPSGSNKPSRVDMEFFAKTGMVHLIICAPYLQRNIAMYDANGQPRVFVIQNT